MSGFVVDTSVVIELFVMAHPDPGLRSRALTAELAAPEILDLEAAHVLRRLVRAGALKADDGGSALLRIRDAPIARAPHRPLTPRIWELRDSVSAYDASYIALAELLDAPLLTCDARLGRAHGHQAEVIVYPSS